MTALSGRRRWQLEQNRALANLAAGLLSVPDEYGDPTPLDEGVPYKAPRQFVAHALAAWVAGLGDDVATPCLTTREEFEALLAALLASPDGMVDKGQGFGELAGPQELLLWPLPGDVLVFCDGHAAIVTGPQCAGCRHCEVVEMTPALALGEGQPLVIRESIVWLSGVRWILRPTLAKQATADAGSKGQDAGGDASENAPGDSRKGAETQSGASKEVAKKRGRKRVD